MYECASLIVNDFQVWPILFMFHNLVVRDFRASDVERFQVLESDKLLKASVGDLSQPDTERCQVLQFRQMFHTGIRYLTIANAEFRQVCQANQL